MKINWLKILANAGLAFFSTLAGINLVIGGQVNPDVSFMAALIASIIPAAISFFKELSEQSENTVQAVKRRNRGTQTFLHYMTVFD